MATARVELVVPRDHPSYEGHFPGRPILPGVVILAEALAAIESANSRPIEEWRVASAKFLGVVTPGTPLALTHETLASGSIRFEIRTPDDVVASGLVSPGARS